MPLYYKLLDLNERGELVSPYGGGNPLHTWPIGKWVKSEHLFSSSETIVDALSKVQIEHFSIVARCEVRGAIGMKSRCLDEIQSKEMFLVKAYVWPAKINTLITRHKEWSSIANTMTAQFSTDFFISLSGKEKVWWNTFLNKEMVVMAPYCPLI